MNTPTPRTTTSAMLAPEFAYDPAAPAAARTVSWGAIFAGLATAIALHILFMMLGAGLGFAVYHPLTENEPVADLGKGFIIIQGISAVLSLWAGGWVAGRLTPASSRNTGWIHGFAVWCSSTLAGALIIALGAGWVMGDLSKLVGGGLALAGQPAAAVASKTADVAKDAAQRNTDLLGGFTDEVLGTRPNATPAETIRTKRAVGMAVARYFSPLEEGNRAANRTALVNALTQSGGMSAADADRTVNEWTTAYDEMKKDLNQAKEQAEAKAREAADRAADALTIYSLCMFASFAIGAASSAWGGSAGVRAARRCDERAGNLHA